MKFSVSLFCLMFSPCRSQLCARGSSLGALLMCVFFTLPSLLSAQSITTLQKRGNAWQLVQDGQPFVMLAGELHNSSSSTPIALHSTMKTAQAMGLNSVIATVSWEQIEPEEGRFDFSCVDELLKAAETYKMRLVRGKMESLPMLRCG